MTLATTLATGGGFKPLFYLNLSRGRVDSELQDKALDELKPPTYHPLIILDDAHLDRASAAEVVHELGEGHPNARWMIVGRVGRWPEFFREETMIIDVRPSKNDAQAILRLFLDKLRSDTRYRTDPTVSEAWENIGLIIDTLYPQKQPPLNLRRLARFFHTWKPGQQRAMSILESLSDAFCRQLFEEELVDLEHSRILLPIAALGAVEISTAEPFVRKLTTTAASENWLTQRVEKRFDDEHRESFYAIDSSDAVDFLEAANYGGRLYGLKKEEYIISLRP